MMTQEERERLAPLVEDLAKKYRSTQIPAETLREWAWEAAEDAIPKHLPEKATLETFVGWHLKKVRSKVLKRVTQDCNIARIPEHRAYNITRFVKAKHELADAMGTNPSREELAADLGWSVSEVNRMHRELAPANLADLLLRFGAPQLALKEDNNGSD
jgi:DNA-directed RNA polymerase sigma subunit (sigma70/sigma32)